MEKMKKNEKMADFSSFSRKKTYFKPFSITFFMVCILCITSILAITWDTKQVYDEVDDSSLNLSLWDNTTYDSGADVTVQTLETADYLYGKVQCTSSNTGHYGNTTIDSENFATIINFSGVENLTFRAYVGSNGYQGNSYERIRAYLYVFGNSLVSYYCNDGVGQCSNTDTSTWNIIRNRTAGSNKWLVYNDGSYVEQITATNNLIETYSGVGIESDNCASGNIAETRIYYVYYEYGNNTLTLNLNSPGDNTNSLSDSNVVFNISAITGINNLVNASLYINDVLNDTNTWTGTENTTTFTKSFSNGNYNWSVYVCETDNCKFSENRTLNIASVGVIGESWTNTTLEGSTETFQINISTPFVSQRLSTAYIFYDGTSYIGSAVNIGGDNYSITRNLNIPTVSSNTNKTFFWSINLEDGSQYNHTAHNQTVNNINIDDCSSYSIVLFNISLRDEGTQNEINATKYNSTIEIDIDVYAQGGANPIIEYYNIFYNESNPQICFENDLGDSTFELYTQFRYDGDGYSPELYHIQNSTLTNSTLEQNVNLYNLKDSSAQKFLINFKDNNYVASEDALIQIQRKYISEGVFKTVSIPKTDEYGNTIAYFDLNNIVYTIVVTKFGEVLATFDNVGVVCQDIVIGDCRLNLNAIGSGTAYTNFENLGNISASWSFSESTRTVSVIFASTDGTPKTVLLNTTKFDRFGNQSVCSDVLTSSSGTLTCIVPETFGNLTIISELYVDENMVAKRIYQIAEDFSSYFGTDGYVMSLTLIITIPLMFIGSPIMVVVGVVLGVIVSIMLMLLKTGSVIGTGSVVMWLIIAGGIIIYRIAKK